MSKNGFWDNIHHVRHSEEIGKTNNTKVFGSKYVRNNNRKNKNT